MSEKKPAHEVLIETLRADLARANAQDDLSSDEAVRLLARMQFAVEVLDAMVIPPHWVDQIAVEVLQKLRPQIEAFATQMHIYADSHHGV